MPSILIVTNGMTTKVYSFKPCYKWNAFNTLNFYSHENIPVKFSFKPCYKWNAFNTCCYCKRCWYYKVLNLIISGMPSIQY